MPQQESPAPRWSSRFAFVLAAAGAAIGLGNLWRFPFLAGENGGGAFVLVYLAAVALVGFPIMVAELMIGRHGRGNAERAVERVAAEAGASRGWQVIGALSIFIPFVGIGYYSVVAGWVVDYLLVYLVPGGPGFENGADAAAHYEAMLASPGRLFLLHFAFMAGIAFVVARGVRAGIERVAKLMMPGLFILLAGLVVFAAWKGDFARGLSFMFAPDFAALGWNGVLAALGQAFFSLAVGIGALMTFGAYLDESTSLPRVAAQICLADTAVALLAGLAIFPIVFAYGLDTNGGEGLVFVALPTAFAAMPAGQIVGIGFFLLVFFAAFTTGVATLEPVVAWCVDHGMKRTTAALVSGGAAWALGAAAALSFNLWEGFHPLAFLPGWEGRTIFGILDYSISSLLLPINGLLIALFVGWALPRSLVAAELAGAEQLMRIWRWLLRLFVPLAILAILVLG